MEINNRELIEKVELLQKRIVELTAVQAENKRVKQIADEAKELAEKVKELAEEAKELAKNIADAVQNPLIVLDGDLRLISVNQAFYNTFKVKPDETIGKLIYDLGNRQWNIPQLRKLLEDILPSNTIIENYEIEHDFQTIGKRTMVLNARRIRRPSLKAQITLLAIEDITELKRTAEPIKANINIKIFNEAMIGRELKMIELKKEIDALLRRLDEKTKYSSI